MLLTIASLDFEINSDGFVYYNDLLFAILKRRNFYRESLWGTPIQKKLLQAREAQTVEMLKTLKKTALLKDDAVLASEVFFALSNLKRVIVNWRKWAVEQRRKRMSRNL